MAQTQNSVELVGYYGSDELHGLAAWTSTSRDLTDDKRARLGKLLTMLAHDGHHTPFERSTLHFLASVETASHIHLIKHRVGLCLAGDTEVWTESISSPPSCGGKPKRTVSKRPIKDLWQNWHIGVIDKPHTRMGRHAELTEEISGRVRLLPSCRAMKLRVLNEDTGLFQQGKPTDIINAGVKEVLELVTDKYTLRCTPEHRIFTDKGWAKAGDLQRLDTVATVGIVGTGHGGVSRYLRTGIGIWTQRQRTKLIRPIDFCHGCNKEFAFDDLELDHVIPVCHDLEKALSASNLRPLCDQCHSKKSATEWSPEGRNFRTQAGAKYTPLLKKPRIVAEVDTYDISVEGPFHNFVANGFVVHNSINGESARYRELKADKYHIPRDWPKEEQDLLASHCLRSFDQYHACLKRLIDGGMDRKRAKESARFYLPYSNSLVLDISMNFRAFMHLQGLRNSPHAQLEIREIAQEMLKLVRDSNAFPLSLEAFGYGESGNK